MFKVGDKVRPVDKNKFWLWKDCPDVVTILSIKPDWVREGNAVSIVECPQNGDSEFDDTGEWFFHEDQFELVTS